MDQRAPPIARSFFEVSVGFLIASFFVASRASEAGHTVSPLSVSIPSIGCLLSIAQGSGSADPWPSIRT